MSQRKAGFDFLDSDATSTGNDSQRDEVRAHPTQRGERAGEIEADERRVRRDEDGDEEVKQGGEEIRDGHESFLW